MTRKMTATEVKAKILSLLDEVAQGEEIEITKHGRHRHTRESTLQRVRPRRCHQPGHGAAVDDDELFTTGVSWNVS